MKQLFSTCEETDVRIFNMFLSIINPPFEVGIYFEDLMSERHKRKLNEYKLP